LAWYTTVPVSYLYFGAATIVAVIVASRIRHFTPYVFSLLSWIFGIISLWLLIRYSIQLTPLAVVGNEFVNKEIFFDTVIYLKPATLFMFTAFLYFAFGLESPSWKERLRNMAPEFRRILLIIAFLVAVTSIFEFTYNAIFLGSRIVNGENPDEERRNNRAGLTHHRTCGYLDRLLRKNSVRRPLKVWKNSSCQCPCALTLLTEVYASTFSS